MPGASYFSELDASSGYWKIKLDEQSSNLFTFDTPSGRYRFKRLPYGIHSGSFSERNYFHYFGYNRQRKWFEAK